MTKLLTLLILLTLTGCDVNNGFTREISVNGMVSRAAAINYLKQKLDTMCAKAGYEGLEKLMHAVTFQHIYNGQFGARGVGKCKRS